MGYVMLIALLIITLNKQTVKCLFYTLNFIYNMGYMTIQILKKIFKRLYLNK